MNTDHPDLTAFALNEISPERATEMGFSERPDFFAATEIKETRKIANLLKRAFKTEQASSLEDYQREKITSLATSLENKIAPFSQPPKDFTPWWNRIAVWQTIAACAVFAFGAFAITSNIIKPRSSPVFPDQKHEMIVSVPSPQESKDNIKAALDPFQALETLDKSSNRGFSGESSDKLKLDIKNVASQKSIITASPFLLEGLQRQTKELDPPTLHAMKLEGGGLAKIPHASKDLSDSFGAPAPVEKKHLAALGGRNIGALSSPSKKTPSDKDLQDYLRQNIKTATAIGKGTEFHVFSKVFRPDPTSPNRFEMIHCPMIKVDAQFNSSNEPLDADIRKARRMETTLKVKEISKPYLLAE